MKDKEGQRTDAELVITLVNAERRNVSSEVPFTTTTKS